MKKFSLAAAAVTFAMGTAASAATLTINGGTFNSNAVPIGSTGLQSPGSFRNDVLEGLGIGNIESTAFGDIRTLGGYEGSNISLSHDAQLKVEVFGWEAGFVNTFTVGDVTAGRQVGDPITSVGNPLATYTTSGEVDAGVLDFVFNVASPGGTPMGVLTNAANGTGGTSLTNNTLTMSFVATFGPGQENATSGSELWLFFDDDGVAGDDHDDLVVRISAVPLPAGALLLMTGLGALALRRKKA